MNIKLPIAALFAVILSAAMVFGLSAASGPSEVLPQDRQSPERQPCLNQYGGNPLDLTGCQQECRQDYGVLPYGFGGFGPGGDNALGNLYTLCIRKCNDDYWKAWDKQMDNLGD